MAGDRASRDTDAAANASGGFRDAGITGRHWADGGAVYSGIPARLMRLHHHARDGGTMWCADLITTISCEGQTAVFIAVDHSSAE